MIYITDILLQKLTKELLVYTPQAFAYAINNPRRRGYIPVSGLYDEQRDMFVIVYVKYAVYEKRMYDI